MKKSASNYDLQVDFDKRIFLEYDQEVLIRKFRLEGDELWIYLNYMNTLLPGASAILGRRRRISTEADAPVGSEHGQISAF